MSEEQESGTKLKQLAELALRQAEYFKDAEKKVYAQVKIGGHGEFYPVKAYEFENWLSAINYKAFDEVPQINLSQKSCSILRVFKGLLHLKLRSD